MPPYPNPDTEITVEIWRTKLADAQDRFAQARTPENRATLLSVLGTFTALVSGGKFPDDHHR